MAQTCEHSQEEGISDGSMTLSRLRIGASAHTYLCSVFLSGLVVTSRNSAHTPGVVVQHIFLSGRRNSDVSKYAKRHHISCRHMFRPRPRFVLLRGGRVRPEDSIDGSAGIHLAVKRDASGHGLPFRLRESVGVRVTPAPSGSGRFVALPPGER